MTTRTYLRSSTGTFFSTGDAKQGYGQVLPPTYVRKNSEQATTIGVHVKGNLKVQAGKVANNVCVMLDPAALRRKMAIEHMHHELQGIGNSTATKR